MSNSKLRSVIQSAFALFSGSGEPRPVPAVRKAPSLKASAPLAAVTAALLARFHPELAQINQELRATHARLEQALTEQRRAEAALARVAPVVGECFRLLGMKSTDPIVKAGGDAFRAAVDDRIKLLAQDELSTAGVPSAQRVSPDDASPSVG